MEEQSEEQPEEDNIEFPELVANPSCENSTISEDTREHWIHFLRNDGLKLKDCPIQDDELVINAILENPLAIQYALEQKEEFCIIAMSRDPRAYNVIQNVSSFCAVLNLIMNDARIGEHEIRLKEKIEEERLRNVVTQEPTLSRLISGMESEIMQRKLSELKAFKASVDKDAWGDDIESNSDSY